MINPALEEAETRAAKSRPLIITAIGLSLGLLAAAAVSPWVGRNIECWGGRPVLAASSLLLAGGLGCLALGALIGPCQVGARLIEMFIARYRHPIWTKIASTTLVVAGLATLYSDLPFIAAALVLYGAGIGLESIARGTLPLALFGADGYATLMGRLALPSLIAQAASPSIGAILSEYLGPSHATGALFAAAGANVLIAISLFALISRATRAPAF